MARGPFEVLASLGPPVLSCLLDVGDVFPDLVVVGAPAEGHERPGDDVDEAPANSRKAALLPAEGSWLAIRVATSVIRAKLPTAL
jgi:hypothetical protein